MDKIKNYLPIFKKIVFLMVILFLILCMPINGIRALADEGEGADPKDSPPMVPNSPSATLQNCLEWYESNHPTPIQLYYEGECSEIVGYRGYLSCEPWQNCDSMGTIGETTDKTLYLEDITHSTPDSDPMTDYVFSVFGFLRCSEPVLRVEPQKKSMNVGEWIPIKVYLDCGDERWVQPYVGEPVILKVVSGPGELKLPKLTPNDVEMLDLRYFLGQDDIIIIKKVATEAMLHATDIGTIEIKATYESCGEEVYKSIITETAIVDVGQKEAKFSGTIFFNRNLEWDKEWSNKSGITSGVGYLRESATLQVTLKYTNTYQGKDYYEPEDASGTYQYSYEGKAEGRFYGEPISYTDTRSANDSGNLERSHIHCLLLHDPEKKKYTFDFSFSSPEKDGTMIICSGCPPMPLSWWMTADDYEYEGYTDGRIFTGFYDFPVGNYAVEDPTQIRLNGAKASWTFVKP